MRRILIGLLAVAAAGPCVAQSSVKAKDTNYAAHRGDATGYAYHGISYATHGSGIGGATWGAGSGVVGNKRGELPGNGVIGTVLEGGEGNGVAGDRAGTGSGNGVRGTNSSPAAGAAGMFIRTDGNGPAIEAIKQGTGDGIGLHVKRDGLGNGDGIVVEQANAGAGQAITAVRKADGEVKSVGYLGYYDPKSLESYGIYAAAMGGGTQLAGRFDGSVQINGGFGVNGAKPIGKPRITGSRGKNQAMKNLLQQLAAYGLIEDATTE